MNRLEFIRRLEMLLSDITPAERAEALQYYNDYLDDAGVENEQEVLDALGSPEKIARIIKDGLLDNGAGGEYTETGFKGTTESQEKKEEVLEKGRKKSMSAGMIILIAVLCLMAVPLLISVINRLFGAGFGIIAFIISIVFGIAIATLGMAILSAVLIGVGITQLFISPIIGVWLLGGGILCAGIAIFLLWLTVLFFGTVLPAAVRGIKKLFRKLAGRKAGGIA